MPIDPEFQSKLKASGDHNGHKIWGETSPPTKRGIHGTNVAVDQDVCDGDEICVSVCPTTVFEMIDSPGHPTSVKKSALLERRTAFNAWHAKFNAQCKRSRVTPPS